jgi:hypothetical protein
MNPAEFFDSNGLPKIRTVDVGLSHVQVCPENKYRYLLMFITELASIAFIPTAAISGSMEGISIAARSSLIFTHALHGALVNMEWSAITLGFGTPIVVVEGFMGDASSILQQRDEYAQRTTNQQHSRSANGRVNRDKATSRKPR